MKTGRSQLPQLENWNLELNENETERKMVRTIFSVYHSPRRHQIRRPLLLCR